MDKNPTTPTTPVSGQAPQPAVSSAPVVPPTPVAPVTPPPSVPPMTPPPAGGQEAVVMQGKHHFSVAIIIVLLLIVGAVTAGAYWYMNYQKESEQYAAPAVTAKPTTAPTVTPTPGIEQLQSDLDAIPTASEEASFIQVDQDILGL